jgi:hypothetical protein
VSAATASSARRRQTPSRRRFTKPSGKWTPIPPRGFRRHAPIRGSPAPGLAWVKAGRYWIADRTTPRWIIAAVFYETGIILCRL